MYTHNRLRAGEKGRNTTGKLEEEHINLEVNLSLGGVGISFIDDKPQELLYLWLEHIGIDLVTSQLNQYFELTVGRMQADNMLYTAFYPILVYPMMKELRNEQDAAESGFRNFLHLSVVKRADVNEVDSFKYLGFGMQELDIQMDGEWLIRFLEFIDVIVRSSIFSKNNKPPTGSAAPSARTSLSMSNEDVPTNGNVGRSSGTIETGTASRVSSQRVQSLKPGERLSSSSSSSNVPVGARGSSKLDASTVSSDGRVLTGLMLFRPTQAAVESRMLYFGVFHLNPISLLISFKPMVGVQSELALAKILQYSGSLGTIENATIRLK